jgi:hypothetical protein
MGGMIALRPRPPNIPFRRGVAIGCVVPADAACHTLRAVVAPDLSATAATGAPNAVNGVPDVLSMPVGRLESHHPARPGTPDRVAGTMGVTTPDDAPKSMGRPGAAIAI